MIGSDGYFAIIRRYKSKPFTVDNEILEGLGFKYSHTQSYNKREEIIIQYKKQMRGIS